MLLITFGAVASASQAHLLSAMRCLALLAAAALYGSSAGAQARVAVRVLNAADSTPVVNAIVRAGTVSGRTSTLGLAELVFDARPDTIYVSRIGFEAAAARVGSEQSEILVFLHRGATLEEMVIAATRSERRIEDDPLRVEVLDREEVEEKLRMTPGDITMMLNETPGLRVQTTSPSLGGANVRVQGLHGRYTQILSDGLPLFGGQTGGLGLLQIPPMDLGGVEVIKGVASALYGGNALGGVINLRSRPPGADPVNEVLANQTMLYGSDIVGFSSRMFGASVGGSGLLGVHRQAARDIDSDGWVDVAQFDRIVARPRFYWSGGNGSTVALTGGTTQERRSGGTWTGALAPDGAAAPESLKTSRYDFGGVGRLDLGAQTLAIRGSIARQAHHHRFASADEDDRHLSAFGETSLSRPFGVNGSMVLGAAVQRDGYDNDQVPGYDFTFTTPGAFSQLTFDAGSRVAVTASARYDDHSEYGGQFSPRVSALLRGPSANTLRLSVGGGFFAPTPLTEETEVTGLHVLTRKSALVAERGRTISADLGSHVAGLETNATFFTSRIDRPVGVVAIGDSLQLLNASGPTITSGADVTARWQHEAFHVTAGYTFIDARERDVASGAKRLVPLTPRHQVGIVGAWEAEGARAGVEMYYTGRQSLADNPYRDESKPYTHLGALVERRFGHARVFVNAENLLGFRQTQFDPLVRPTRGPGGRWTVDAWGPLEGRTANVGVRF